MDLREELCSRRFAFGRIDGSTIGEVEFRADGSLIPQRPAESFWALEGQVLQFMDSNHNPTTIFEKITRSGARLTLTGRFLPIGSGDWHRLTEITAEDQQVIYVKNAVIKELFGISGDSFNLSVCAPLAAAFDSANYVQEKMRGAVAFANKWLLLEDAMQKRTIDGQIFEFGVYSGSTINHLAKFTDLMIYGFDVFTGLPENWRPGFPKGSFNIEDLPRVDPNVKLVVGLFEETLPEFVRTQAGSISLMHVDCDLYSSTKTIFSILSDKIVEGTIIVFDEYFNFVGWRTHEFKAFQEFIRETGKKYEYISYVDSHQQVAVRITRS